MVAGCPRRLRPQRSPSDMVGHVLRIHPLLKDDVRHAVERAVSDFLGEHWTFTSFTDLNDQASHPAGVFHGPGFSVFVKLGLGSDSAEQFTSEVRGLAFVRDRAAVVTPTPIGNGVVAFQHGYLLLFQALRELLPEARTDEDWSAIGRTLAMLHQVRADSFGLGDFDGFFGPLRQDNRPVTPNRWAEFYAERRVWMPATSR